MQELILIDNDSFPGLKDAGHFSGCNIMVDNGNLESNDSKLFGDQIINIVPPITDMYDILVALGCFPSKGQAGKNWKQTGKPIPNGWSHWLIGKGKANKFGLFLWNPSTKSSDYIND